MMAAALPFVPYITGALAVNSLYGAVTGQPGGLIGEIFGADKPAPQQQQATPAPTTTLASVTPPPAEVTAVAPTIEPPKVEPVVAMPSPSGERAAARRESLALQRQRQGRASTILTQSLSSDTLG